MNKKEIQDEIEKLKMFIILQFYCVGYLNSDYRLIVDKIMFGIHAYQASIPSSYGNKEFLIDDFVSEFKQIPYNNIKIIEHSLILSIIFIHDVIKNSTFNKQTPEFEFLRHIRNAMGHGNRFTFLAKEPVNPASYKNHIIDKSLQGMTNVISNYLSIGDAIDLLDFIKNNL